MKKITVFLLCIVALMSVSAQENTYLSDYNQARKFTGDKLATMLFSTKIFPRWTPQGDKFWYEYKTSKGNVWYIVNPKAKTKKTLFDQDKLAAELSLITHDPIVASHLPINNLEAKEDGTFEFSVNTKNEIKEDTTNAYKPKQGKETYFFSYNPESKKLTRIENKWKATEYPQWASISPDGKTVVFAKDFNLYKMSREEYEKVKDNEMKEGKFKDKKLDSTIVETQLTTFGVKDFGFGMPYSYLNTDTLADGKRKGIWGGAWSPDSKHFIVGITDERKVKELWVINSMASPRPTLETYKYEMPGDKDIPQEHLYIFDIEHNTYKEINTKAFKDQSLDIAYKPRQRTEQGKPEVARQWAGTNTQLFITRSSRDLHRIDICKYVLGEDTLRPVIEERMNTYQEVRPLGVLGGGEELLQWSERDGWAHLYLYDSEGKLKKQLTQGAWHVMNIEKIDEKNRVVYFTANGKNPDENPYYQHVYKVSLNGGEVKEISKGNYFHEPFIDDEATYFIDNYSRIDCQPKTALFSTSGVKIMDLEEADMSQLLANGYQYPEQFTVKAADGVTDLWGVMYKPFNFDATRVYPIIDYV